MKTESLVLEVKNGKSVNALYPQNIVSLMVREIEEYPIIKNYHGDLYHDIKKKKKQLEELRLDDENYLSILPFYWGLKDCGTNIGRNKKLVLDYSKIVFKIFLTSTIRNIGHRVLKYNMIASERIK